MKYAQTHPCGDCPFRRNGGIALRPERAQDIGEMMIGGGRGDFACHKTTADSDDDDEGSGRKVTKDSQHCAGALIFAEKQESGTQMMRIVYRLGLYDPEKLDMTADVFDDLDEMIEAHELAETDGQPKTGRWAEKKSRPRKARAAR